MNWKNIKTNATETGFEYEGKPVFKTFREVLKFHEPGLAPVADDIGWFHIDSTGNSLYKARYIRSFGFYCGRAAIWSSKGWFHINIQGSPVYAEKYAWCGNFQSDICAVRNTKNEYFHIGLDGQRLYVENYCYAGDFKDGYACVKKTNGLFVHIDTNANQLNGLEFLDLGVFHKGFATAKDKGGWHHINRMGLPLYKERYAIVEPFYNGFALVEDFTGRKIIIGEDGEKVLTL